MFNLFFLSLFIRVSSFIFYFRRWVMNKGVEKGKEYNIYKVIYIWKEILEFEISIFFYNFLYIKFLLFVLLWFLKNLLVEIYFFELGCFNRVYF